MTLKFFFLSVLLVPLMMTAQSDFVIKPTQSMLMTGKGAGQDATINPYTGQDCYAIVENTAKRSFTVRIQEKGRIITELPVEGGETKKIELLKGQELYFDSNPEGKAKARISYEAWEE